MECETIEQANNHLLNFIRNARRHNLEWKTEKVEGDYAKVQEEK